jgi:hypothetical protein
MNAEPAPYSWLPEVLAEIAEIAGLDVALKLAEARGGTEIYIPASAADDHWLVELIGREAADAICGYFAFAPGDTSRSGRQKHHGIAVMLPVGPAGSITRLRAKADRMIAEKRPTTEIARALGYTTRTVERRKARARRRDDKRQGELL